MPAGPRRTAAGFGVDNIRVRPAVSFVCHATVREAVTCCTPHRDTRVLSGRKRDFRKRSRVYIYIYIWRCFYFISFISFLVSPNPWSRCLRENDFSRPRERTEKKPISPPAAAAAAVAYTRQMRNFKLSRS